MQNLHIHPLPLKCQELRQKELGKKCWRRGGAGGIPQRRGRTKKMTFVERREEREKQVTKKYE